MIRLNTITLLFTLIFFSVASGLAAEKFDIDIKELRPATAAKPAVKKQNLEIDISELKSAKTKKSKPKPAKRKPETKTVSAPEATGQGDAGRSSYTMQPGDHLALVLVRHYGLTEVEARRLMPEIMRLNSISSPQKVSVGQRLIIPLPLPSAPQPEKAAAETPTVAEQQQKTEPAKPAVIPAEAPTEKVSVIFTDACGLARQLPEKLGLIVSPSSLDPGGAIFTISYNDLAVTISCESSPAEVITYQRLLAMKGEQLLALNRNEFAGRVVEKMAEVLGLTYSVTGASGQGTLPLAYVFTNIAPGRPPIELTISAP